MISYRMLLESDAEAFARIRVNQLREEGAQEVEGIEGAIAEYCRQHIPDGSFVAHLALDGEKIIGTCGISLAHKPPYFQNPGGKIALLSSMYILPEYRRRGIARTLLEKAVRSAKEAGCRMVQITASKMGVPLYESFGFTHSERFLEFWIEQEV